MTPNHTDKAGQPVACEVPLIKQLRSVPKDCRVCIETQWGEDGTPTGHRYIPVGRMIHEAADALTQAAPPDSLAVAQALEEWESTFDCNAPQEAYAEMRQAVLARAAAELAWALEAVKKIGRDLQFEPIPEWSQPFRDGYREGISEYVHRINTFALTSAAETRRQVKKRRAARKQAT